MTSFQQFEANRRNALRSTGPKTENGKRRSRVNAVRHGLAAERERSTSPAPESPELILSLRLCPRPDQETPSHAIRSSTEPNGAV
jgi:hypothetical protein